MEKDDKKVELREKFYKPVELERKRKKKKKRMRMKKKRASSLLSEGRRGLIMESTSRMRTWVRERPTVVPGMKPIPPFLGLRKMLWLWLQSSKRN